MSSPVQDKVGTDERRRNVENLRADASECVEDGIVEDAGEGVLAVVADSVGNDALLLHATYSKDRGQKSLSAAVLTQDCPVGALFVPLDVSILGWKRHRPVRYYSPISPQPPMYLPEK